MGSAPGKMADTSESAPASDDLPVIVNFSGEWSMDASKSESLEALFAAMDAGWLARKIAGKLKITTHFYHTNESVIITDHSFFGNFTLSLVPDGKWRPVLQLDGKSAPMRCMFTHSNGELRIETRFSKGTLLDRRRLLSRTAFEQVMRFAPSGEGAAGPDVSARRSFNRVETDDERHAAEAAEESARLMLAHQAAALSLLSGGFAGGLVPSSWKNAPAPVVGGAGAAAVPLPKVASSVAATASGAKAEAPAAAAAVVPSATAAVSAAADPFPSDRVPTADFSGSWLLDRTRSDTLDAMLTLMGIPWIARKIANSIEITAVMRHEVLAATAVAEDHSSMGITSNEYTFDGKPKNVTSKEGKTSVVTASLIPVPWPVVEGPQPRSATALAENPTVGASGCIRISTVLPDGAGETIDTRCLVEGGRTLRQLMVYKKGDKTATLMRFLRNDKFDAAKYEESVARVRQHYEAKAAAAAAPAAGGAGAEAAAPAAAAAGTTAAPMDVHSSADAASPPEAAVSSAAADATAAVTAVAPPADGKVAAALDPCFVSVGGYWTVDASRSETLDSLWKSLGVGWFARVLVGAVDIVHHVAHTKGSFRTEDKSALGTATVALSLDGRWHPVKQLDGRYMLVQARQTLGGGDLGPLWLGDLGWIPRAWLRASQLAAAGKLPASIVVPPLGEDGEHDGDEQLDDEYEDDAFSDSDGEDAHDDGYRPPPPAAAGSGSGARTTSATSSAALPPLPGSRRRLSSAEGAAAAGADDGTSSRDSFDDDDGPEATLAPEARGRHTILRRFPVRVAPFATAEIEVVTVLSDVTAQREALERQSESAAAAGAAAASAPVVPLHSGEGFAGDVQPPAGAQRLVVTYSMSRRDEMVVTHTHLSAEGAVLHAVRRVLIRREAAEQRAVADVADSARIQHACSLIIARRSAADDMKLAYLRRVLARRARRQTRRAAEEEARRRAAASLAQRESGNAATGGAGSAARSLSSARAAAAGGAKASAATAVGAEEEDESLADGVQCAIM